MEQYPLSPIGEPGRVGDTSQKGNWSCFRNETLNFKTPFIVTIEADIPKKGVLEFDFMSSRRPSKGLYVFIYISIFVYVFMYIYYFMLQVYTSLYICINKIF